MMITMQSMRNRGGTIEDILFDNITLDGITQQVIDATYIYIRLCCDCSLLLASKSMMTCQDRLRTTTQSIRKALNEKGGTTVLSLPLLQLANIDLYYTCGKQVRKRHFCAILY
jgi:hypothetical protein